MSPEVLLTAGYVALLTGGALVLEWLSAHTHRRAERYRTAGFTYDETHDHWECPMGSHLRLHELDWQRRLARYRAKAQVCNACSLKAACTDSDEGREIVRPLDPWPHSEAGRFHRAISLVLVGVATLIVIVEGTRHHRLEEVALLLTLLAIEALAARRLAHGLAAPVGAPS